MSKAIVQFIKHANFPIYKAYPTGFIWKNRQLYIYIYTNTCRSKFDFLYIKQITC